MMTLLGCLSTSGLGADLLWPEPVAENRPWTRWWWLGRAVDRENLTYQLEGLREAGFGGVEICPIYGVKGHEEAFLEFLSPDWMEMLSHTVQEAGRLGLKVDMTTGTGWPFGGPGVSDADASEGVELIRHSLRGGEELGPLFPASAGEGREGFSPSGEVRTLLAESKAGERINLTSRVEGRELDWIPPDGEWTLYGILVRTPIQEVKRPAPGGAGSVVDPYSVVAMSNYLARFDDAFGSDREIAIRSQFHDSFEYYGATWTDTLLADFTRLRGYKLVDEIPALFGEGEPDRVARVRTDYRETISDLHLAYVRRWTEWSHLRGSLTRNQAHGAPANLVDLYASVDIPETEIFGAIEERHLPMQKFASSAAHLMGRTLASAESFTWLNEHFNTTLAEAKQAADYLFIAGINHLFYHGIPYSPKEAPWPGWQFYASVNFGPQGGLWRDLSAFNAYLTRVQSILQSGQASNDVLLYFPLHDIWHHEDDFFMAFTIHNVEQYLEPHAFFQTAERLWSNGYTFDYLSDAFLREVTAEKGQALVGGNRYRAILVPRSEIMPEESVAKLAALSASGIRVVFQDQLPTDVPGMGKLEERRASFLSALGDLAKLAFIDSLDNRSLPEALGFEGEPLTKFGLRFMRREWERGFHYFIANRGEAPFDGWLPLRGNPQSVVLLDPSREDRAGRAAQRTAGSGTEIYLRLGPGESVILRTFENQRAEGPDWTYHHPMGEGVPLPGNWKVTFVEGGPVLPVSLETDSLVSWTCLDDVEAHRFSGTARYSLRFDWPVKSAENWLLDLGEVAESARVRLNGRDLGILWFPPFTVVAMPSLREEDNQLEIEVTNLAANRIRDLDQRGIEWKVFYDINVVGKNYRPLDASQWPLRPSGLLGPVKLVPLEHKQVDLGDN